MKKLILSLSFVMFCIAAIGQQEKYGTKTIGQWSFEKFPLHYTTSPAKTMKYKNQITGKLEVYEEQNNTGQTNGLKLTMRADGIHPDDAIYMYKGQMVYSVHFFHETNTAKMITTYNLKGQKHGYRILRELKSSGGYTESIERYENDVLTELNGVKQAPMKVDFTNNLLHGKFKFETKKRWIIEGEAENGKLKRIKQSQEGGTIFMCEITFTENQLTLKEPYSNKDGMRTETYKIASTPLVTNSKELCLKYGNYNGYPYLYLGDDFELDIKDLKTLTSQIFLQPFETKANYSNGLLNGDFQYREYITKGGFEYEGFITVTGKAEMGKIKFLRARKIECNTISGDIYSDKATEYTFNGTKIQVNEFVPELPDEPVSTSTLDYVYPVLLTNSESKGGSYSYSYNNTNNVLNIPIKRDGKLKDNEHGYMYFSPTTFDVTTFISTVTTKTEKPVVQKTNFNNGFLDGDFEFKEDRIHFIGVANGGIIRSMKVQCDFETSKDIVVSDTVYGKTIKHRKTIKYDAMQISLSGNEYKITYMNSANNAKDYEETVAFSKNKKITNSENLAQYDNFTYCTTYKDLRNNLFELKFFTH